VSDRVRHEHISPPSSLSVSVCTRKNLLQFFLFELLQVENRVNYFLANLLRLFVIGKLIAKVFYIVFESVSCVNHFICAEFYAPLNFFYLFLPKKVAFGLVVIMLFQCVVEGAGHQVGSKVHVSAFLSKPHSPRFFFFKIRALGGSKFFLVWKISV
jgi:hypothetical protein